MLISMLSKNFSEGLSSYFLERNELAKYDLSNECAFRRNSPHVRAVKSEMVACTSEELYSREHNSPKMPISCFEES
jgi:hypothetical protein